MLLPDERPEIDYPADWTYQVIGSDETVLRGAILEVVGERPHVLQLSNTSSKGKYCSLRLEVRVQDEAERLKIFQDLGARAGVKIVL